MMAALEEISISSPGEIKKYIKMSKLTKYIFLLLCLWAVACQRVELEGPSSTPDVLDVSGEATVKFSVSLPSGMTQTKAMGDDAVADIKNLYLIVFDSNGYYLESRQAVIGNRTNNTAEYTVTLTMTNQRRIIHFVANCPIDQVKYGHENEVISKLYVSKAQKDYDFETAYWHRIEIPYIIVDANGHLLDSNGNVWETGNPLKSVPLLRNYTQITVEDNDDEDDNFHLLSYAVYNTINIGTVAPYNQSQLNFQAFGRDGFLFSYDRLLSEGFEGHALPEAELDGDLTEDDFIEPGIPYFMYERKISVRAGVDESEWSESPTHVILKGIYTGPGYEDNTTPTYYKVDLIREVNNSNQYYNLLRNFDYTFKLRSVVGAGYQTFAKAMDNPAGNNLAGDTKTQKLTDVSDGTGRIQVSFTDTTLVSNHDITFKFRYIPDINATNPTPANRSVSLVGDLDGNGSVLKGLKYTIDYEGDDGWAKVVFRVKDPTDFKKTQTILLNAGNNPNLQKNITFTLVKPYSLDIICYDPTTPKEDQTYETPDNIIDYGIEQKVGVYLRIPSTLTPDMFPLQFKVEADKLSISPDVSEGNRVSVVSGQSIIPGKPEPSFHYLYTIDSYEKYKQLTYDSVNDRRVVITRWLTNMYESASYVVVDNKYFNIAASYFRNNDAQTEQSVLGHKRRFTDLRIDPNPVFKGKDVPVQIMFDLDSREQVFLPKKVHVALEGMVCTKHNDTDFDVYLTADAEDDTAKLLAADPNNKTKIVEMQPGSRSVIIDGLKTTVKDHSETLDGVAETGPIRFTLSTPEYGDGDVKGYYTVSSDVATRIAPYFTMLSISPNPIMKGEGVPVDIKFMMDADDEKYYDRELTVTLYGLKTPEGHNSFDIKPTQGSLVVRVNDLLTSTSDGNVSFKVEEKGDNVYKYEPRTSEVVERRSAKFWGLRFDPVKVPKGAGRKVSLSFNMDEEDETFANRALTLTLDGMKYVAQDKEYTTLNFTPSDTPLFTKLTRYMTIGNLVTTSGDGNVSFTISDDGGVYQSETLSAQRAAVEFKNLSFTRDGDIVSRINEGETVDFNFSLSYYEPGMKVDVTLDGFEPYDMPTSGDGSLVEKVTRAAKSYVFTPYDNKCKLKLKAISTESPSYSVQLAAESYGYATPATASISKAIYKFDASASTDSVTNQNTDITIEFTIPVDAWQAGVNTMPVYVTLDRLTPSDNKLVASNERYVYNVTKNNNNTKYSFKVKPSESGAGICKVKLEAAYFETAEINNINQTVTHALKAKNSTANNNIWDAQAVYQLKGSLTQYQTYALSFYVKADKQIDNGNFSIFLKVKGNDSNDRQHTLNVNKNITNDWQKITIDISNFNRNDFNLIAFNIGKVGTDNAIYFDQVSLKQNGGSELITNGDFETDIQNFVISQANPNPTSPDTWWLKTNTGANPTPQCTLSIVSPGCE